MKKGTMKEKQTSKYKGFYTAIGISILMIGAACVYAYQVTMETNQTLENELSQTAEETQPTTNFIAEIYDAVTTTQPEYDAVAKVKTDVPVETTTEAVEETEPQEEPESEPEETEEEVIYSHMLMIPVDGEVAQPFSDGELVKSLTTGTWQTHNGVDILAEQGVSVRAMDNGTVVEVVNDPLWGICVSVDHENGIVSRYCNLSPNVGVQEGDTVESGQTLGTVGDSADIESKMESHLHFEVTKGGTILIPKCLCAAWISILKPTRNTKAPIFQLQKIGAYFLWIHSQQM